MVTGVIPVVTDAVSVTTLPEAIVVAALPPAVTARVVVVAVAACAEAMLPAPHTDNPTMPHAAATLALLLTR